MAEKTCDMCGKIIGNMDFYVIAAGGRFCGGCVVEARIPVRQCRSLDEVADIPTRSRRIGGLANQGAG